MSEIQAVPICDCPLYRECKERLNELKPLIDRAPYEQASLERGDEFEKLLAASSLAPQAQAETFRGLSSSIQHEIGVIANVASRTNCVGPDSDNLCLNEFDIRELWKKDRK